MFNGFGRDNKKLMLFINTDFSPYFIRRQAWKVLSNSEIFEPQLETLHDIDNIFLLYNDPIFPTSNRFGIPPGVYQNVFRFHLLEE